MKEQLEKPPQKVQQMQSGDFKAEPKSSLLKFQLNGCFGSAVSLSQVSRHFSVSFTAVNFHASALSLDFSHQLMIIRQMGTINSSPSFNRQLQLQTFPLWVSSCSVEKKKMGNISRAEFDGKINQLSQQITQLSQEMNQQITQLAQQTTQQITQLAQEMNQHTQSIWTEIQSIWNCLFIMMGNLTLLNQANMAGGGGAGGGGAGAGGAGGAGGGAAGGAGAGAAGGAGGGAAGGAGAGAAGGAGGGAAGGNPNNAQGPVENGWIEGAAQQFAIRSFTQSIEVEDLDERDDWKRIQRFHENVDVNELEECSGSGMKESSTDETIIEVTHRVDPTGEAQKYTMRVSGPELVDQEIELLVKSVSGEHLADEKEEQNDAAGDPQHPQLYHQQLGSSHSRVSQLSETLQNRQFTGTDFLREVEESAASSSSELTNTKVGGERQIVMVASSPPLMEHSSPIGGYTLDHPTDPPPAYTPPSRAGGRLFVGERLNTSLASAMLRGGTGEGAENIKKRSSEMINSRNQMDDEFDEQNEENQNYGENKEENEEEEEDDQSEAYTVPSPRLDASVSVADLGGGEGDDGTGGGNNTTATNSSFGHHHSTLRSDQFGSSVSLAAAMAAAVATTAGPRNAGNARRAAPPAPQAHSPHLSARNNNVVSATPASSPRVFVEGARTAADLLAANNNNPNNNKHSPRSSSQSQFLPPPPSATTAVMPLAPPPSNGQKGDPAIVDLRLHQLAGKSGASEDAPVKKLSRADKNSNQIMDRWIQSLRELMRTKPPDRVHYAKPMPSIEALMQEWPQGVEQKLKDIKVTKFVTRTGDRLGQLGQQMAADQLQDDQQAANIGGSKRRTAETPLEKSVKRAKLN